MILVSSDVMELIGISDRIFVAADRQLVGEVRGQDATEERIVGSAVKRASSGHDETSKSASEAERTARSAAMRLAARYGQP